MTKKQQSKLRKEKKISKYLSFITKKQRCEHNWQQLIRKDKTEIWNDDGSMRFRLFCSKCGETIWT